MWSIEHDPGLLHQYTSTGVLVLPSQVSPVNAGSKCDVFSLTYPHEEVGSTLCVDIPVAYRHIEASSQSQIADPK